jgi:prepilin signal peptidase PulO-like enzyme (type II secretory pathway)
LGVATLVTGIFLLAIGAAVGSFLNVVVYRVPMGGSILWPSSQCRVCHSPIRWFDNIPVLSWFILRGRCRDCGTAISPRYPLVEALTALLFLTVGLVEGRLGAPNLPSGWQEMLQTVNQDGDRVPIAPESITSEAMARYVALSAYHLVMLCTLVAVMLIHWDRQVTPVRVLLPALVLGIGLPLLGADWLRPPSLGWAHTAAREPIWAWLLGVGGVTMATLALGCRADIALTVGVLSAFFGWQAGLVIAGVAAILWYATWHIFRRKEGAILPVPFTGWLTILAVVWLLGWSEWVEWFMGMAG